MKPLATTISAHSVYRGVQISNEITEASARGTSRSQRYFTFTDKLGHRHIRNTARGGTLAQLKGDIDFYLSQGWV